MPISTRSALQREINKLITRHNAMCRSVALERRRYKRRSGRTPTIAESSTPSHWGANPRFNPYYVRSHFSTIFHAISSKLRKGMYKPDPILLREIPKKGGGQREISLLTIPDAAVSYALGYRLIQRNVHFFTSYTYAYRNDRNAHHAIQHLMSEIRGCSRLFALEFDFSKYFDSIQHDYLLRILDEYFLVSRREREIILQMLKAPRAKGVEAYQSKSFSDLSCGIPQGSTLSLFLANVACHELDREIEREGAVFARYADDTVILCNSYEKADRCARLLMNHGKRSGTKVNFAKSDGLSVLTTEGKAEMNTKHVINFLSHSLSSRGVGISHKSVSRIKSKVAKIIQQHLLLQPGRGDFNKDRLGNGFRDWDLVTCINELRRYIYGRVTEEDLNLALSGSGQFNVTRCALSFYPTVDIEQSEVFKSLDGWLVDILFRAYIKRVQILASLDIHVEPISKTDLISGVWYSFSTISHETKLPSFYRSWLYVRRCARIFGLSRFPSPIYEYG